MVSVNKKDFNINYFSDIKSETQAYLLGFIYADGSISKQTKKYSSYLTIQLAEQDKEILELFVKEIYPSKNILKTSAGYYKITIYSNKLVEDLLNLGVKYNKTYKELSIPLIKKDLIHHFIRGFFDGDGSVWKSSPKAKRKQWGAEIITASKQFCNQLINTMNLSYNYNCRKAKVDIHRISFSGKKRMKFLYNYLYKDANVYLKRKYNKFQDIIC